MASRKARSGSGSHPLFLRERSSFYGGAELNKYLADITRMLGCANEGDLQRTRDVVKKYSPWDCEDLESMIRLGKPEHDNQT